jgi:hypothetical protein
VLKILCYSGNFRLVPLSVVLLMQINLVESYSAQELMGLCRLSFVNYCSPCENVKLIIKRCL